MKETDLKYIIYIKYAVFEGEDRHMLFARKFEEIANSGVFYWGYGSYDITPSRLKPLLECYAIGMKKSLLFFHKHKRL